MQKIKRLRVFAGPNCSGKSTLFEEFSKNYNTGFFINSDKIEKELDEKGFIDLEDYGMHAKQEEFSIFFAQKDANSLITKSVESGHLIHVEIKENLIIDPSKDSHSYEGALVAMFLRDKLMDSNQSFCFETVMSHASKLQEINMAKEAGYKIYLYFVCIDDPEVNISRIDNRVNKGGHDVDDSKVIERYPKTLNNLFPAIELSDKAYLFDNSGDELTMIAEIENGMQMTLHVDSPEFPNWFKKYVLNHYL